MVRPRHQGCATGVTLNRGQSGGQVPYGRRVLQWPGGVQRLEVGDVKWWERLRGSDAEIVRSSRHRTCFKHGRVVDWQLRERLLSQRGEDHQFSPGGLRCSTVPGMRMFDNVLVRINFNYLKEKVDKVI